MRMKAVVTLGLGVAAGGAALAGTAREVGRCPADPAPLAVRFRPAPVVQLAILLDTSNSMDGLIDQARSQLWKIVNELAAARRHGRPALLQVALYEYGNSRLSASQGYVRQALPFTTDLDRVSEELFGLKTLGGDEYCGTVIQAALDQLRWSRAPGDLKVVFVAGNEPFSQGPVDFRGACARARARGIVVNTIHCGPRPEGERTGWKEGAMIAQGLFSAIDQDRAVEHVEAPQDSEIARLGVELNDTYVPFGTQGRDGQARQEAQDGNAATAGPGSAIHRAVTKASRLYANAAWDLVDAVRNAQVDLGSLKEGELPAEMRALTPDQRRQHLDVRARERERIQGLIHGLNEERNRFVAQVRRSKADAGGESLDLAMSQALREQAACKAVELE